MIDTNNVISRRTLVRGGSVKYFMMMKNRPMYQSIVDCFDLHGRQTISSGELTEYLETRDLLPMSKLSVPRFLAALTHGSDEGALAT
jgi:hypothetical protein